MYLLDIKRDDSENVIRDIDRIQNKNDLINEISSELDGIDYFFSKVSYALNITHVKPTETTRNNIRNLFSMPPLSIDENSEEFKSLMDDFEYNISRMDIFSTGLNSSIVSKYKSLLLNKIESNKDLSSYDIVGQTTRNFNKLFYGNKVIQKEDMDLFLYEVEKINPVKLEKTINDDTIEERTNLLLNKLNLELIAPIELEEKLDLIYKKITDDESKKLLRYEFNELEKNHNSQVKSVLFDKLFDKSFLIEKEPIIKEYLKYKGINESDIEALHYSFQFTNITTTEVLAFLEYVKQFEGYRHVPQIIKEIKLSIKKLEYNYNVELDHLITNYNLSISKFGSLEEKKNQIKTTIYKNKLDLLNEYKEIKKDYVSILDINDKSFFINKEYIKKAYYGKFNKSNLKTLILDLYDNANIKKYSLNEIKQYLNIASIDNKNIYKMVKSTSNFKNLSSNSLIKDIINGKIENISKERLNYVSTIIINKENLDKLFTTDININIKDKFYDKLGLTIDDDLSKSKLNDLFKIFQDKQDSLNYNNSNILLGVILESYENKKFSNEKFETLFNLVKTPIKSYTQADKDELNKIEDKWLKWAICYNREIKDTSLVYSGINPLTFDFSKMQTMKKIFQDVSGAEGNTTKKDYNTIELLLKDKKDNYEDSIVNFNLNYSRKISKIDESKRVGFENMFSNALNSIVSFQNHKEIGRYVKKIRDDLSTINDKDPIESMRVIHQQFKELFDLSKAIKIFQIVNKDGGFKNIFNSVKKNSDLLEMFSSVKDKTLLHILADNIHTIPKLDKDVVERYLNYYNEMSKLPSVKNFKLEDCLIPVINKEIGNKYSYSIKTIKDFDILLTGEKTNCCMTINGQGFDIYKYMYENPKENVIFEVYKDGKPIANSWTWIKDNKICFDNIEVLGGEIRTNVIKAYQDIALEFVVNHGIEEVTLGTANSDINVDLIGNYIKEIIPQKHLNCYTDSSKQLGILSLDVNNINLEDSIVKIKLLYSEYNQDLLNKHIDKINEMYPTLNIRDKVEQKIKQKEEVQIELDRNMEALF